MNLRFVRLDTRAQVPSRAHPGDAGLDLRALEHAVLKPGGRASIGTGIAVQIPPGHAGLVLPRSGLAMRHGISIVNAPGLIDAGYRGEVRVLLLNTDPVTPFEVTPGARIAQLVVMRIAPIEPAEVPALEDSVRGAGGFGSSGR
ncbi:MAG TPA: dUTP diphosphatase [Solirubrobacteraceae bacterium]|nr:dUTP diphosphatase [Solirubrobacteraceae bacterium]